MAGKAVPDGMADQLRAVTTFLFAEDPPQKADILFIPPVSGAGGPALAGRIRPYVLPSGRYSIKKGEFPGPVSSGTAIPVPMRRSGRFSAMCW